MPAVAWDADHLLVVFADDERIEFALGGGVLSVVVDADFDAALGADEVVNLALKVAVPGTDDAWVGHRVVGHLRGDIVLVPVLAVDFNEMATLVGVYLEVADFEVVDHIQGFLCTPVYILPIWVMNGLA